MKNLCIYHDDIDGFAAATVIYYKFGNQFEYYPAQYSTNPILPDVINREVLIVDFSYKRQILLDMKKLSKNITVLDHHQTAEKELEGLDFCHFDMTKSGAVMTWEYLFKDQEIPLLLKYIQDRDLWKWELPHSKEISAAIQLLENDFVLWIQYLLDDNKINSLIEKGKVILEYQNNCVQSIVKKSNLPKIQIAGYTVPCINITHLISETLHELAKDQPFAVGYFDDDKQRIYSLRSSEDGIDVSEIAKKYGGGGHKHAAGFTTPILPITF